MPSPRKPAAKKAKTDGLVKFDAEKLSEYKDDAASAHADGLFLFEKMSEGFHDETSVDSFFAKFRASPETLASQLYTAFPPIHGQDYFSGDWTVDGLTKLHLYQICFDLDESYNVPTFPEVMAMAALMLGNDCTTDPAIPGIDALAIKPSESSIAKRKEPLVVSDAVINAGVGIQSVGIIKGRKRSFAALAIAIAIIRAEYDCSSKWPSLWNSLRVLHATVKGCS